MAKPPTRDLLKIIFTNFFNSFRPRKIRGDFVGEDYFGNKFYEIPVNRAIGKSRASRWFEPKDKEAFDNEITSEWQSWLRGRREDPPTREELIRNLQTMETTKMKAAELDKIYSKTKDSLALPKEDRGALSFPKYKEYEIMPGQEPKKKE